MKQIKILKESLNSIDSKALLAAGFDLVLVLFLFISLSMWIGSLSSQIMSVTNLPLDQLYNAELSELESMYSVVYNFLFSLIIGLLLTFVIFILLYTIFKGLTWSWIYAKKFSLKKFFNLFLIILVWFTLILFLIISLFFRFQVFINANVNLSRILMIALIFFVMYFTNLLFFYFLKDQSLRFILKNTFFFSFRKMHNILPYFLIFYIILLILIFSLFLNTYWFFIGSMITLIYLAVSRIFFSRLLEKNFS
ncbi:MAG: hypothetical protein V1740_00205 [Candidatus Woesearchaeota archaeon]